jgi:3-oxoadipate enol-lactonase
MTVVLCGSLGSTAELWELQTPVVPDAVVVEHPGHGAAPLVDDLDLGALARRVLDAAPGRFSFVGLSLGAAVGMRVAATAPDRVDKLVLAGASARFGEAEQWVARARIVRAEGLEAIVDGVMERWFTPSYPDVARWRAMFLSADREGYARCCEALAGWDGTDDLARIAAPTLVIAGAADPTAPPAEGHAVARAVAGARFEVVDGAAHVVNVEAADSFNTLLGSFL